MAAIAGIDWSSDGSRLVTGGLDHSVRVWKSTGELMHTFDGMTDGTGSQWIMSVKFTPDGKRIVYTHGGRLPDLAGVIDASTGEEIVRFDEHSNTVYDLALSPDTKLIATAAGSGEMFLWKAEDGEIVHKFVGEGRVTIAAGWSQDGTSIAWGNSRYGRTFDATTPLDQSFSVTQLEPGDAITEQESADWHRARLQRDTTSLALATATSVNVLQGNQPVTTLQSKGEFNKAYDTIHCCTLLSGNVAVVGSEFTMSLYDTETGEVVGECVGHTGPVYAVSHSQDERYLLSTGSDMTLRVWNVGDRVGGRHLPLLSLFFAGEDWIAWTPQGYYAASPGGESLMGWHVNNGPDQLATFLPAGRFRKQFYRPDVIKLLLTSGSVEAALKAAGSAEQPATVAGSLPPKVTITSPESGSFEVAEVTVRVRAEQTGIHPITSLQLLVDGRPLNGKQGIVQIERSEETETHLFHVPLIPGVEHVVRARADNAVSYGLSNEIRVAYEPPNAEVRLPSLYVLAIGVANYDDTSLRLNYAGEDARKLARTLQERSLGLFDSVDTRMVIDNDATRRGILAGLAWLKREMTQHDVGVVFFSGHGAKDEVGDFYLLPTDVDVSEPLAISGVPDAQVKSLLQSTPGRLVVMLDACHSGSLGGDRRKAVKSLTDDLVRDLANDDYGIIIMASSTGREFSLESQDDHSGYFTLAICEGLEGLADTNRDTHVYFNELDLYVTDRVKALTDGKQHPVTAKPTTIRSFPLASGR